MHSDTEIAPSLREQVAKQVGEFLLDLMEQMVRASEARACTTLVLPTNTGKDLHIHLTFYDITESAQQVGPHFNHVH